MYGNLVFVGIYCVKVNFNNVLKFIFEIIFNENGMLCVSVCLMLFLFIQVGVDFVVMCDDVEVDDNIMCLDIKKYYFGVMVNYDFGK